LLLFGLLAMAAATAGVLSSADVVPPSVAYRDGPPPGFSGGFGEQSCHACHFSAEPNQPPGAMSLSGLPERYTAGETYVITLTLSRPGMAIGGFQLTARFADSGAAR
jgi:hypothetical protein